jgi:hypothetical protein
MAGINDLPTFAIDDMTKGMNAKRTASELQPDEFASLLNYELDDGDLVVRPGFGEFANALNNEVSQSILGMCRYTFWDAVAGVTVRRLAVVCVHLVGTGADLYMYDDDGNIKRLIVLTWAIAPVSMTVFDGKLLICNGGGTDHVDDPVMVVGVTGGGVGVDDTYLVRVLAEIAAPMTPVVAVDTPPLIEGFESGWTSSNEYVVAAHVADKPPGDVGTNSLKLNWTKNTWTHLIHAITVTSSDYGAGTTKNLNQYTFPWRFWVRQIAAGEPATLKDFWVNLYLQANESASGGTWYTIAKVTPQFYSTDTTWKEIEIGELLVTGANVDAIRKLRWYIQSATVIESACSFQIDWLHPGTTTTGITGSYYYSLVFRDSVSGRVSATSPESLAATPSSQKVALSFSTGADPYVDEVIIYRRKGTDANRYKVGTMGVAGPNLPIAYNDVLPDDEAVEPLADYEFRQASRDYTLATAHGMRVAWAGDPNNRAMLCLTDEGEPVISRDIEIGTLEYQDPSIGGYIRVGSEMAFTIQAMAHSGSVLLLFSTNTVYGLYGSSFEDFQVRLLRKDIGCPWRRAVDTSENDVVFFDGVNRTVYAFDGETFREIGYRLRPRFKEWTTTMVGQACVIYFDKRVFVFGNDAVAARHESYVYSFETDSWTEFDLPHTGRGIYWSPWIGTVCKATGDPFRMYLGHSDKRVISYFPTANNYDVFQAGVAGGIAKIPIEHGFTTADFNMKRKTIHPRYVEVLTNDGDDVFTLTTTADGGRVSRSYRLAQEDTAVAVGKVVRPSMDVRGQFIQIALAGSQPTDATTPVRIKKFSAPMDVIR